MTSRVNKKQGNDVRYHSYFRIVAKTMQSKMLLDLVVPNQV